MRAGSRDIRNELLKAQQRIDAALSSAEGGPATAEEAPEAFAYVEHLKVATAAITAAIAASEASEQKVPKAPTTLSPTGTDG